MKNFKLSISKHITRTRAFIAATLLTTALAGGIVYAGFGPERPVFDWNNAADRKGSLVGPVFNSFVNTPTYGDERNFGRIAPVVEGQSPLQANFTEQTSAEGGKEYWVRTFVHNNANQTTNCLPEHKAADGNCTQVDPTAPGVAKNTRVRVAIAEGTANGVDVMSYISADNAVNKDGQPLRTVWDSSTLNNDAQRFSVSYVPGSATIFNSANQAGLAIPNGDAIVSAAGVPIGYSQMNGNLPGCFDFSAYVYVKVKVSSPKLDLVKQVRKAGDKEWKKSVDTKPGETVQWLVHVTNSGSAVQNNVVASDLLPPNVSYVDGTAKWYSKSQNGVAYDFNQFTINQGKGGYVFGNYAPAGDFLVRFDTKVNSDFNDCSTTVRNVAHAKSDQQTYELSDFADVKITKENCNVPVPTYRCDLLTIAKLGDRKYSFKVDATATNGATVKSYVYNFGDDSAPLTTDKNVVEYTYAKEGTFTTTGTVNFAVAGQDKSDTNANCAKPVTVTKENCTVAGKENLPKDSPECKVTLVVTPTTPTVLPNTGAGSMIGIFGAVTVAGAFVHRYFLSRRFNG